MTIRRYKKDDPQLIDAFAHLGVSVVGEQIPYKDVDVGTMDVGFLDQKMAGAGWSFVESDPSNSLASLATTGLSVKTETGTTYTLALADIDIQVRRSNVSANTTEVPLDATVPIPIESVCIVAMAGTGLSSITKEVGVTLNSTALDLNGQGTVIYLHKVDTDEWDVIGGV